VATSIDIAGLPVGEIRTAPSPLAELAAVLHMLAVPGHHPDAAAAVATMAAAVPADLAAELADFGLLWVSGRADFLFPAEPRASLRAELDEVDRLDDERWVAAALGAHRAVSPAPRMWSPLRDRDARRRALASARARGPRQAAWAGRVLGDPGAERERVRRALLACEAAFFGAVWERLRPGLTEEAARRRFDLAREGLTALDRISPAIRADPGRGVVTVDKLQGRRLLLGHAGPDPQAPGVISTRVGYTGGDVPNATYRNHGTARRGDRDRLRPGQTSYRRCWSSSSRSTTRRR
jgi:hypothetical protein